MDRIHLRGATLLQDAGLLDKCSRYTCHPSVEDEFCGQLEDCEVVIDGNILTARGAGSSTIRA